MVDCQLVAMQWGILASYYLLLECELAILPCWLPRVACLLHRVALLTASSVGSSKDYCSLNEIRCLSSEINCPKSVSYVVQYDVLLYLLHSFLSDFAGSWMWRWLSESLSVCCSQETSKCTVLPELAILLSVSFLLSLFTDHTSPIGGHIKTSITL